MCTLSTREILQSNARGPILDGALFGSEVQQPLRRIQGLLKTTFLDLDAAKGLHSCDAPKVPAHLNVCRTGPASLASLALRLLADMLRTLAVSVACPPMSRT
jgi:hypothetical protein